ncbi:hypothetical protein K449DRAFT_435733 [Hypoxylon sp. EC38]|nr:hypothetical protein K449DRAFT_435733 [Hypoxylon sp. EC38]
MSKVGALAPCTIAAPDSGQHVLSDRNGQHDNVLLSEESGPVDRRLTLRIKSRIRKDEPQSAVFYFPGSSCLGFGVVLDTQI